VIKGQLFLEIVVQIILKAIQRHCSMIMKLAAEEDNNISVISWRSVLLVEETGVPGENHGPAASH
jgi:hypothetical protein